MRDIDIYNETHTYTLPQLLCKRVSLADDCRGGEPVSPGKLHSCFFYLSESYRYEKALINKRNAQPKAAAVTPAPVDVVAPLISTSMAVPTPAVGTPVQTTPLANTVAPNAGAPKAGAPVPKIAGFGTTLL